MFIDEMKVFAAAGHGGKGAVAFHRESYVPKGGPSGGNGGRGGDVILEADHDLNNLIAQFYQPRLIAQPGQGGLGKGMDGKAGKNLVIKVPCGTLVWRLPSTTPNPNRTAQTDEDEEAVDDDTNGESDEGASPAASERPTLPSGSSNRPRIRHSGTARALEMDLSEDSDEPTAAPSSDKGELIADLTTNGQTFVLCKGGRGGLGNRNFATSVRQTPRFAQPGEPGEYGDFLLELRIVAEVGVLGYPNAGKSTLLAAISKARPKIAPYPFTTLHPNIGIVEYDDFKRLTVCDVPGLIEGAHQNVGLGHKFLRHIQRCSVLVVLLDMAGTDARAPWDDYKSLLREVELYDPAILAKPRLIVANKMDEAIAEKNLKTFKRKITKTPVLPISAAFDSGMELFRQRIREAVEEVNGR